MDPTFLIKDMHRRIYYLTIGVFAFSLYCLPLIWAQKAILSKVEDVTNQITVLSEIYTIDKKYKSMMGPTNSQEVTILKFLAPELIWITGYQAVIVGADGQSLMPQQFMCHSNLDFNLSRYEKLSNSRGVHPRLFTLSQGQYFVHFPKGFGIPIMSNEPLSLTTQVLNLNHDKINLKVRHKITIDYVHDSELTEPMKPLYPSSAYGLVLLEGDPAIYGIENPNETQQQSSCLIGTNASSHIYTDQFGRKFSGHWVVKPGRQVKRTLVNRIMNLDYDTTVHYIAVHLHPFAESLELRDLTTD